ncbi:MAG: tRNA pseudouridine38-40 synthase [Candidatus Paceibacteria bacterium]|jgi:tRNA pseudouridine38-40 synthase
MRNVRLEIQYDGAEFFGWQRQDGLVTVQETLEDGVVSFSGERVTVQGSGRTDRGVHALRQVASFHIQSSLSDDRLRHALNAHLPETVVVNRLETCSDDFHARFSARGKRYVYTIATRRFKPSHAERFSAWSPQSLDFDAMRRAGRDLVGKHDFRGLCSTGSYPTTTVRTVRQLRWIRRRGRLSFVIEANGFLYNMVRAIAGTLLDVGRGRLQANCVQRVLEDGDRGKVGPTAPAGGLYLLRVLYDERIFPGADAGPHGSPGVF